MPHASVTSAYRSYGSGHLQHLAQAVLSKTKWNSVPNVQHHKNSPVRGCRNRAQCFGCSSRGGGETPMCIFPLSAKPLCSVAHRMEKNTAQQDLSEKAIPNQSAQRTAQKNIWKRLPLPAWCFQYGNANSIWRIARYVAPFRGRMALVTNCLNTKANPMTIRMGKQLILLAIKDVKYRSQP
jgi:hypothetical protein